MSSFFVVAVVSFHCFFFFFFFFFFLFFFLPFSPLTGGELGGAGAAGEETLHAVVRLKAAGGQAAGVAVHAAVLRHVLAVARVDHPGARHQLGAGGLVVHKGKRRGAADGLGHCPRPAPVVEVQEQVVISVLEDGPVAILVRLLQVHAVDLFARAGGREGRKRRKRKEEERRKQEERRRRKKGRK